MDHETFVIGHRDFILKHNHYGSTTGILDVEYAHDTLDVDDDLFHEPSSNDRDPLDLITSKGLDLPDSRPHGTNLSCHVPVLEGHL